MTVKLSQQPEPGAFTGAPVRIPFVMFCTNGERWCGWVRTANTREEFTVLAADRRTHEMACKGGLIIAH